jgi:hypothetical protein
MRTKTYVLFFIVSMLAAIAASNAQEIQPQEPLRITLDCSRFRGPDDTTAQVELYYSFPQAALTYVPDSAGYKGMLDATVTIKMKDSVIYMARWLAPHLVSDTSMITPGMNLVSIHSMSLTGGEYTLRFVGRDMANASRKDSVMFRLSVHPVGQGKTVLSDVEFASTIRLSDQKSVFYKNRFEVRPNVGGVYGENQTCFYYAEAYNLLN